MVLHWRLLAGDTNDITAPEGTVRAPDHRLVLGDPNLEPPPITPAAPAAGAAHAPRRHVEASVPPLVGLRAAICVVTVSTST